MISAPVAGVTGYVLAGGRSSRMGQDKAFLEWRGATLLEHALKLLETVCERRAILCGSPERASLMLPHACGASPVSDGMPGEGPLAGVVAAAADAKTPWLLVMPIDLPLLPAEAVRSWVLDRAGQDACVCCLRAQGVVQPLPVLLRRSLLPALEDLLRCGERRLRPALMEAAAACSGSDAAFHVTSIAELPGASDSWFHNLNTPEDLEGPAAERGLSGDKAGAGAS